MRKFACLVVYISISFIARTQAVAVNSTGAAPNTSAMLDVSSTTKGVLLPRLTTAQRNTLAATAAKGLLVYDSIKNSFYFHDGTDWVQITDEATTYWTKSGNRIYNNNPGNVGIGQNVPVVKLDVSSSINHVARLQGDTGAYVSIYENSYWRGYIGSITGNYEDFDIGTGSVSTGKMHFTIKEVPKMTLDLNGYVGIGTTSPGFPLTIVATADEGIGLFRNATFSGAIRPTDTTIKIHGRYGSTSGGTSPADLVLQPPSNSAFLNLRGNIGMFTDAPKTDLHINGKVLIGNVDPATGYTLSVDGKIISEEVRVQLSGSWPDYVFNTGYKLQSLPQLEQFIKGHHHLPNIPSASEMKKGQDLGDMQRRMMEKIEELTLYIIELEKKNLALEKRIVLIEQK